MKLLIAFNHPTKWPCKTLFLVFNALSGNPTILWNTLKQFVNCYRRIFWACLTISWGWRLKNQKLNSINPEILRKFLVFDVFRVYRNKLFTIYAKTFHQIYFTVILHILYIYTYIYIFYVKTSLVFLGKQLPLYRFDLLRLLFFKHLVYFFHK